MCGSATPSGSASRRDHMNRFCGLFRYLPGGRAGDRSEMQKVKFAKTKISKLQKRQNEKSQNLSSQFFLRDRSPNCSPQDRILALTIAGKTFPSSLLVLHSQCVRCIFNASKQCPNEATTFYLAGTATVVRSEPRRTQ
jgi:hypothetical protein